MLKIETGINNKILRDIAEKIEPSEIKKFVKLGNEMVKYIKKPDNGGCGLAGPQVGVSKRIIVVSMIKDRDDENFKTIMMLNPEILEHSEEKDIDIEGCLSIPSKKGKVERYSKIKLRYTDEKGKSNTFIYDDFRARIIQHEIDHLDGVLFVDKVV